MAGIYQQERIGDTLADGQWYDLYLGNPRTGTQPIRSVQFTAAAPNLLFTNIDPTMQTYSFVERQAVQFVMSIVPD